MNSYKIS